MFKFILRRLKEPSTWAGIVTLLTVFGVTLSPEQAQALGTAGAAVVGALLVFTRESGEKDAVAKEEYNKWVNKMMSDTPPRGSKDDYGVLNEPLSPPIPSDPVTMSVLAKAAKPKPAARQGLQGSLKNRRDGR